MTKEGNKYFAVLHHRNKMVNAFASRMGCWFRRRCSLMQCNFLCGNDCLSGLVGTNQSGIPQWRTWETLPSAHPAGAGWPERRSLCKSNGGPYKSPADMRNHGSLGHAWSGSGNNVGCLKYEACFSGLDAQDDSVLILRFKDEDLLEVCDDSV